MMRRRIYTRITTRTTIDIDDTFIERAACELGTSTSTSTKVDTVHAALTFVADRRKLLAALEDPLTWGSPEVAAAAICAAARH